MYQPIHGGNLIWAAEIAGCPVSSIVDFSASINPLGCPPNAIAAIAAQLSSIAHYPDPSYHQLRNAVAQWHEISPDWILPGNGAAELLTWAGRELGDLSSTVLPVPAFRDYERALAAFGATVERWHWDWRLDDLGVLQREINRDHAQPQGLLLNNPHNPTGHLWRIEQILPLFSRFELIVLDEAFMDFLPPEQQQTAISWIEDFPNLIILRSLTKFFGLPGLRLGYVITHPDRIEKWQQWRDPWSVNCLAEIAAIESLKNIDFQRKTWQWLPPARETLFQGLQRIRGLQPILGAVNFLLVESDIPTPDLQVQLLKRYQILIRDCVSFPELGDRFFRVAVRTEVENERLLRALTEIIG